LGEHAFAFRYSLEGGPFLYCDADGSEPPGFTPDQAGTVSVLPFSCQLEEVDRTSAGSGEPVRATARFLLPGVTEAVGQGAGIRGQVGVGTQHHDASSSPGWGWQEAVFRGDVLSSGEDEYEAIFHPAYTGDRAVSFRFSLDDGASWTYCDLDGSLNGYQPGQQHGLMVGAHAELGWCNLQWPASVSQGASGQSEVYGQVYASGLTPDPDAPITAQLGYGQKLEDPGLAWAWIAATFNTVHGNNNEYLATLQGLAPGTYHYAFRFVRHGSQAFCFGDLDGAGGANGFNGEDAQGGENLGVATILP
jgi:hypothetical protein